MGLSRLADGTVAVSGGLLDLDDAYEESTRDGLRACKHLDETCQWVEEKHQGLLASCRAHGAPTPTTGAVAEALAWWAVVAPRLG